MLMPMLMTVHYIYRRVGPIPGAEEPDKQLQVLQQLLLLQVNNCNACTYQLHININELIACDDDDDEGDGGDEAALQATVLYYLLYSYNGTSDVVMCTQQIIISLITTTKRLLSSTMT